MTGVQPGGVPWNEGGIGGTPLVARRPPSIVPRFLGQLFVRVVLVGALGVGIGYVGQWLRTDLQAQDGWIDTTTPSNNFRLMLPRTAETGQLGPTASVRAADQDWEVVVLETSRTGSISGLAAEYGNEVSASRLGGLAKIAMGRLGGTVKDVETLRHPLGKNAVTFTGTYSRDGVERYLRQVVVLASTAELLTLRVEADASRSDLVDFLFDEVNGSLAEV